MLINRLSAHRAAIVRGMTLVELMVTISLLAILLMLAVPEFNTWINNTRVRTIAEGLQNGVRLAQAEAVRRNRTVAFFLTNADPSLAAAAAANGGNWGIRTVALFAGDGTDFVRGAMLNEGGAGVTVNGPAALCFNAAGQQVTVVSEGCAAGIANYAVARAGADRALNVVVSLSGRVRMCDPAKTLSDANPDGC